MTRQQKQIFYISAYFLIMVVVALLIYVVFLKPTPTCFDNKLNQNESGVDCGGLCISCELKSDPIKLNSAAALEKKEVVIVFASLRNESVNFGSSNFQYNLALKDFSGQIIHQIDSASFIYPGQADKTIIFFINKVNYKNISYTKNP